jgi:bacterioferritin
MDVEKLAAKLAEKRAALKAADINGSTGLPQAGRLNRKATPVDPNLAAGVRESKQPAPPPPSVKQADESGLAQMLNKALADELSAIVMYIAYAAKLVGPHRPALYEFLSEEVGDETRHATFLANKIVVLGGEPVTQPSPVAPAHDLQAIMRAVVEAENRALTTYTQILKALEGSNEDALRVDVENILSDERKHFDESLKVLAGL